MASPDTIAQTPPAVLFSINLEKAFPGDELLNRLIGEAYFEAASATGSNMPLVTEMLEQIRENFFYYRYYPYKTWYYITIDRSRFDKDPLITLLINLKNRYYSELAKFIEVLLQEQFSKDQQAGFNYWLFFYMDALLNWEEEMISFLFKINVPFAPHNREKVEHYRLFNNYFVNFRYNESFPFYLELAEINGLSPRFRSLLLTVAARSLLYGQRARDSKSYFDKALGIEVNTETIRGFGEYYLFLDQYDLARDRLQEAINTEPKDILNYLLMGDTYKREAKFEVAEQWYKETINTNFLFVVGYERLIELYGLWEAKPEKKDEIPGLIEKAKRYRSTFQFYEFYDIYRTVGSAYSISGDYATSEKYYQLANDEMPGHTVAKLDLGYIYAYQKKYDEAFALFTGLIAADESYYEAYQALGWLYEEQKLRDKAIEVYQSCLQRIPSKADRLYNLIGNAYWINADYPKAVEYFTNAINSYANEPIYYENLLDALLETDKKEETEKLLLKMISLFDDAVNYHTYFEKLAYFYLNAGDFANAEKYFLKRAALAPDYLSFDRLGNFYYDQNNLELAITHYQKAIELKPDEAMLYEHLGIAYQMHSELDAAEKTFRQAMDMDPRSGAIINRLGLLYYNQNKFEEALPYFEKALEREENNEVYQFNIAMAYDNMGKPESSLPIYQKLLTTTDEKDLIKFRLGLNSYKRMDYKGAFEWFNEVKNVYNDNYSFMEYFSPTLAYLGEVDEAIEWYEKALIKFPDDDYFNNQVGMLYHTRGGAGDMEKAKAHYLAAIAKNPDFQDYKDNLALALNTLK